MSWDFRQTLVQIYFYSFPILLYVSASTITYGYPIIKDSEFAIILLIISFYISSHSFFQPNKYLSFIHITKKYIYLYIATLLTFIISLSIYSGIILYGNILQIYIVYPLLLPLGLYLGSVVVFIINEIAYSKDYEVENNFQPREKVLLPTSKKSINLNILLQGILNCWNKTPKFLFVIIFSTITTFVTYQLSNYENNVVSHATVLGTWLAIFSIVLFNKTNDHIKK
ncbi:MAG: hypothetical protein A2X25_09280 [Chloroflexi bacterium GWB2_49_20]|nr:MAG: hypothetical protein A2X25_09280 [Chloroflexi bacterium GWB2_49_20]OGN79381.1 MAG: hypothetical protein A2X26_04745 [Chloroflexi bacterium GWC2_49_37]OGN82849.1 MAG: hypothetical protein A2X27_07950 [Chloroflexi bacterium GWD2_49_16]HCC78499.1 hypothetical protein [Anaerolineae bacterium]HCM97324.1 hypothetical protein [Anaerolineae bacterium]